MTNAARDSGTCCGTNQVEAVRALEKVAAEQAGFVTSALAAALGVSRMAQRRLAEAGLLHKCWTWVYRLVGASQPFPSVQAGNRLSTTDIQQAMLAGVLAGYGISEAILD